MATKNYCNLEDLTVYDEEIKSYIGSHGGQTYTVDTSTGLSMSNNQISIGVVPIANGGTGKTNRNAARVALSACSRSYLPNEPGPDFHNPNDIWCKFY